MIKIQDIPKLSEGEVELLEAVGYLDAVDLIDVDSQQLYSELVKANETLAILADHPTEDQIKSWQDCLKEDGNVRKKASSGTRRREQTTVVKEPANREERVNFENDPNIIEMLEVAPEAELLPGSLIKRHQIAVKDIPEAILLTNCEKGQKINTQQESSVPDRSPVDSEAASTELESLNIRNFDQIDTGIKEIQPLDRGSAREILSPSEGLNDGVQPASRRFIRGVLHPKPSQIRIAAFFTLLFFFSMMVAFIGIPLALVYEHMTGQNTVLWVLAMAGLLFICGLCYAIWGASERCRVCNQRQFVPRKCLKHKQAHRFPLIGYILPTALHLLWYKWSHCIYCGTSVRTKK